MAMSLEKLDHPVTFLLAMTLGVIGLSALLAWFFASMKWTGPLGLVKGGVQ
jgi:hypothetical protein